MPYSDGAPPVWLLGSRPASAAMAAHTGLAYAYAHFINPTTTRAAIDTYRASQPSGRVMLGVGVHCADTESQARRLYASHQLLRTRLPRNILAPLPDPDTALKELAETPAPPESSEWPRCVVGSPEQVRDQITTITNALSIDELAVMAFIHDHKARVRSYELLAEALDPRQCAAHHR